MRKNYKWCNINEMGNPKSFLDGKSHPRFGYERGLMEKTNCILIENFFKCAKWIEENHPNLNGEFECRHDPYHKTILVIENGKAYLETGSHSSGFSLALSTTETASYTQGSCQGSPYAFEGCFFFRNDRLEEFLSQWTSIKSRIEYKAALQKAVYSDSFKA